MNLQPLLVVGPLYTGSERGLAADILAARAEGLAPFPICTQLVVASGGTVTDVNDVPVDTVIAQLEHTLSMGDLAAIKIGGLASASTVHAVMERLPTTVHPVVLDLVASGPSGETLLNGGGVDAIAIHLGKADLVMASRADAELVTGGSIESLDDAQVAAQRLHHRGAARVLIRCGHLPYRFYDAAEDPGGDGAGGAALSFDLYYDGEDFALFEAPQLDAQNVDGLSSVFAIAVIRALMDGLDMVEALQQAKRAATDSARHQLDVESFHNRIAVSIAYDSDR